MILRSNDDGEMMVSISSKLRNKIKKEMVLDEGPGRAAFGGRINTCVWFNNDEYRLFKEACSWWTCVNTYFSTSYEKRLVKADIGRFRGIFPQHISQLKITFSVDCISPSSWKDWFIQED